MIVGQFGFQPTACQQAALQTFGQFLADRRPESVMILRGSAGTGKTSLAAAMVGTLHRLGQKLTHRSCCKGVLAWQRSASLHHPSAHLSRTGLPRT